MIDLLSPARLSRTAEIYGTTSGNECTISYVVLHVPDLWYGRQIDNSTYIYVVQCHIAPRARLRLVWGSLTLAQLLRINIRMESWAGACVHSWFHDHGGMYHASVGACVHSWFHDHGGMYHASV